MKYLTPLLILALYSGCNYIPCSASSDLDNVKKLSNQASIAGIYKPDEFTKQDFKEYSNSDTTFLEIDSGGIIVLYNFPEMTFGNWEKNDTNTVDGSGTWVPRLSSGTIILSVDITFNQKGVEPLSPFRVFRKADKYYILIDFGDPDNCTSVRLKQQ